DDKLDGGCGEDALDGGCGNDNIDGGWGNDYIVGGAGDDILKGNWGDDVFYFCQGDGKDIITDFNGWHDTLQIDTSLAASLSQINITQTSHTVTLDFADGTEIQLQNFCGQFKSDYIDFVTGCEIIA
ncbi:hypothetical protein, partial [Enterovibrio norvegicus]